QFNHVEPPHWWAGMESDMLEILVHGKDVGVNTFEIKRATGVVLEKAEKTENPNYVILHLDVSKAAPQTFTIASRGKAGRIDFSYRLKERKLHDRSLDQSDLIYLITPDRFANGDPDNDSVEGMNETGTDRSEPYARHGGDIQGIIDHLDFIADLGVTAVWPNPLYENDQPKASYHGYAFTDHYKIDRRFGTNELFGALCDSLHNRGMKMVMDVVYNHVGDKHHIYADMPDSTWFHNHAEYTQTNYRATTLMDPYASRYDKDRMTDGWFDRHMPDLDQTHPRVATYLIQQTLWWIEEYGIDALRIDTYAYPDQGFMREWAQKVEAHYPDLFIFAETWVHGPQVQGYFLGDALGPEPNHIEGLTDFQVHYAINDALTRNPGWTEGINRLYYTMASDYLYEHPENLVTFVDNHDVARFYGVVNQDFKKFAIGIGLLFTLRGIPSLYYGTEILMAETDGHGKIREDFPGGWPGDGVDKFSREGRTDDENRAYNLIRTLALLRQNNPALQTGKTTQYAPTDGVYAYFRHDDEAVFLIAVNTTADPQSRPKSMFEELMPEGSTPERIIGDVEFDEDNMKLPGFSFGIFKILQ
ncbi:MAG: alpha-amylase family glycosyl hydrolase, partial [Cryomorphaceae bacterium]